MLLVNSRVVRGNFGGIQRYTSEIIKRINFDGVLSPKLGFSSGINGHLWEQIILPKLIKSNDLLWSPSNTGPIILENQIVTIHDLSPIDHPEWFSSSYSGAYRFIIPKVLKVCRGIVADSLFTKERIIANFKIPDHKISVIYLGVSDISNYSICLYNEINKVSIQENFFITVSTLSERKNLKSCIEAWNNYKKKYKNDHVLYVVGEHSRNNIFKYLEYEHDSSVIFLGFISNEQLIYLYKNAIAMLYLSVYEGFGLPPLEAMYYDCPVICSNTTSVGEVVGNAALKVNPINIDEIVTGLVMISNITIRNDLIALGKEHVRFFTWESTAQNLRNLFSKLT